LQSFKNTLSLVCLTATIAQQSFMLAEWTPKAI